MSKPRKDSADRERISPESYLRSVPHLNRAVELNRRRNGTALATVPMRKPRFLVPPLSWLLPYSSHRRIELDAIGVGVIDLCDGTRTVAAVVEEFAERNKLTFRESQLAVTRFLRQLTERGVVAIVGTNEGGAKR